MGMQVHNSRRRCGTCRHWHGYGDLSQCLWPEPTLPFWAVFATGDHGDYTKAEQGTTCMTWEEKGKL